MGRWRLFLALFFISSCSAIGEKCIAPELQNAPSYKAYYESGKLFETSRILDSHDSSQFGCSQEYVANSCCSQEYTIDIDISRDPVSTLVERKLRKWSNYEKCRKSIHDLACVFCHPSQTQWIEASAGVPILEMCTPFCEELFTNCGSAIWRAIDGKCEGEQCSYVEKYFTRNDTLSTKSAAARFCFELFRGDSDFQVSLDSRDDTLQYCFDNLNECTEDDFYPIFTECDINGYKYSTYKIKNNKCAGGVEIPEGEKIRCEKSCEEGFFLNARTAECEMCPAGQYSLGGGFLITNWTASRVQYNDVTKVQTWTFDRAVVFTTYCERVTWGENLLPFTDSHCGWHREELSVSSGEEQEDNSLNYVLETQVIIQADKGKVRFSFTVEGEQLFDGFRFYIDDEPMMERTSKVKTAQRKEFTLDQGFHTLKWKYEKDPSYSVGIDMASLMFVEVSGIRSADYECSLCPPGHYQNSSGSNHCIPCGMNEYQDLRGQLSCKPCHKSEYAFPGSESCTEKELCTMDDYGFYFKQCQDDGQRKKEYYSVDDPKLCNDDIEVGGQKQPEDEFVNCARCEPGEKRKKNNCVECPEGTFSNETNSETCYSCPAGTEAIQTYTRSVWEGPDDDWDSVSFGDFGSPIWRNKETYTDSGVGHGSGIQTYLMLNITIVEDATLTFDWSLHCNSQRCMFLVAYDAEEVGNNIGGHTWEGGTDVATTLINRTDTVHLTKPADTTYPFNFMIYWGFLKYDPSNNNRNDQARIYRVSIKGADRGGAVRCDPCPPGEYNDRKESYCTKAPAGFYAPTYGTQHPIPCPGNSFSDKEGATECKQCGEGIPATQPIKNDCEEICEFTPPQAGVDENLKIKYSVASLRSNSTMYGPIVESLANGKKHYYYLNMCTKKHSQYGCTDVEGNPVKGFACQITTGGFGVNLGSQISYRPYPPDHLDSGFFVDYLYGEPCGNVDRSVTIDMICAPDSVEGPTGKREQELDTVETRECHYDFEWKTPAACPMCNSLHWRYDPSECVGGYQTLQYRWVQPKKCYGGSPLPKDKEVECMDVSKIKCQDGQYLSLETLECTDTSKGAYSIQNGQDLNYWPENWIEYYEAAFATDGWYNSEDTRGIKPANFNSSFVSFLWNFTANGVISVEYKVYSDNDDDASELTFFLNDRLAAPGIHDTNFEFKTVDIAVTSPGVKVFKIVFLGASEPSETSEMVGATVRSIKVRNIAYVPFKEEECPSGFTSEFKSKSKQCISCGEKQKSDYGSSCDNCWDERDGGDGEADDYIGFKDGPTSCQKKLRPCSKEEGDIFYIYSTCSGGVSEKRWQLQSPSTCYLDNENHPIPPYVPASCRCRLGEYLEGDECKKCAQGYYYSAESKRCVQVAAGSVALPVLGLFTSSHSEYAKLHKDDKPLPLSLLYPDYPEPSFPSLFFTTGCSGSCSGDGWIAAGSFVHSGKHRDFEADSYLSMNVTMVDNGYVSFAYVVHTPYHLNGLRFYVDGLARDIPYNPSTIEWIYVSLPLAKGLHQLRWDYHQAASSLYSDGYVKMKDIVIIGSNQGGAIDAKKCPAGYYSDHNGASSCTPCQPGFTTPANTEGNTNCIRCTDNQFSEESGSPFCFECGRKTFANADNTGCDNNGCKYTNKNLTYDLSPLSYLDGVPFELSRSQMKMVLNICSKGSSDLCVGSDSTDHVVPIVTHACLIQSEDVGYDVGRIMDVNFGDSRKRGLSNETTTIYVTYTNGSSSNPSCPFGAYTVLELHCNLSYSGNFPVQEQSTPCALKLSLATKYACPVCNVSTDYVQTETDCEDGFKTIKTSRSKICVGEDALSTETVPCTKQYKFPLAAIIVAALVFVILAAVVLIVVIRNRKVEQQYSLLLNNVEKTYELSSVEAQSASSPGHKQVDNTEKTNSPVEVTEETGKI